MSTKKAPRKTAVPKTSRKTVKKKPSRRPPAPEDAPAVVTKTITFYITVDSTGGELLDRYDVWTEEPERVADLRHVIWRGNIASHVGACTRGIVETWLGIAPNADNQIAVMPFTYTESNT